MKEHTPFNASVEALSERQLDALRRCADVLFDRDAFNDERERHEMFELLGPCNGCLPEQCIGEDLLLDIRQKFAALYLPALDIASEQVGCDSMSIVIDASYENATYVAVVGRDKPNCYLLRGDKAWQVQFRNLPEIADFILQISGEIVGGYKRAHAAS